MSWKLSRTVLRGGAAGNGGSLLDQKLDATAKQPYRLSMADGSPMAFAGLWERWKDPASGEAVRSFTTVTTEANELCAPVHNCMPVILDAAGCPPGSARRRRRPMSCRCCSAPSRAERMEAHEIGPEISNVRNDNAGLIERLNSV